MTPEATQQPPTEQDFKIKTYNITRVVSVESENEQGDPITKTRVILKDPELGKLVVRFNKDLSKFFTDNPNAKIAIQGDFKEGSPVATISLPGNQNIPSKMLQTVGSD